LHDLPKRFQIFSAKTQFLKQYPYFLPCAVPALFSFIAWLVTFLYFKETLAAPISPYDNYLILQRKSPTFKTASNQQTHPLQGKMKALRKSLKQKELYLFDLYSSHVFSSLLQILPLYRFLDMAVRAIQPLFTPLPFTLEVFGVPLPLIGTLLSGQAVLGGLFQVLFFARIHKRFGSKKNIYGGDHLCNPYICYVSCCQRHCALSRTCIAVWIAVLVQIIALVTVV